MRDLWFRLIGLDPARVAPDAETSLVWLNAPRSWGVFVMLAVLAAVVWGVFWLYRHEIQTCPRWARLSLAAIRSAVLLVLAAVLLNPALAIAHRRVIQPIIVLLIDESSSMSNADQYIDDTSARHTAAALAQEVDALRQGRPKRTDVMRQLLARDDGRLLRELSRHGIVRVMTFASKPEPVETIPAEGGNTKSEVRSQNQIRRPQQRLLPLNPKSEIQDPQDDPVRRALEELAKMQATGQTTNLHRAVRESLKDALRGPVAAVVLFTDGQNTEGDDPMQAAAFAAEHHVSIMTVGVGDARRPPNVSVTAAWPDENVWRDDPFQIEVAIGTQGVEDQTLPLELVEQPLSNAGEAGSETVVARQDVAISAAQPSVSIPLKHTPKRSGRFLYTLRLGAVPNDANPQDNRTATALTVRSDQARVLLISGTASWEYQLLRSVLMRDKTINLSCWLQSMDLDMPQDGNTVIHRLPDKPEELFKYDVVVMLDPNPSPSYNPLELTSRWQEVLRRFVGEHSGGLLYMAGPAYSARLLSSTQSQELRSLLPVTFSQIEALDIEALVGSYNRPWSVRPTAEIDHAVTRFDTDRNINRAIWESLPGIYWSFPSQRAKPGTMVLLEHPDPALRGADGPRPLLVAGQYASGRTLYMGFAGTWRWRSAGHDSQYFDRFWVQAVRYLIEGRRMGGQRRGLITADRDTFAVGERITLTAKLLDERFEPLVRDTITASLQAGRDVLVPVEFSAVPDKPGTYQASIIATQLGMNVVTILLPAELRGRSEPTAVRFNVELPRVEHNDPTLNRTLLTQIANRSGGRYFEVDQIADLAGAIPDRRQTDVYREKPIELWDTTTLLILLATLLTVEWAMRKRFKLM
ncbi:MAG: vWA domain-containing protein [Phycisphaeraceae bacterium]